MSFLPTLSIILSETIRSLYPIAVKIIPANLFTQTFYRLVTFTAVSAPFVSNLSSSIFTSPLFYAISLVNLLHIFSSYQGFENLNAGVSITLFYIYPFFNILLKSLFSGQKIDNNVLLYFSICLAGVFLISLQHVLHDKNPTFFYLGLGAILLAALSESIIYTFYKVQDHSNPFDSIFTLYFFGTIIMLLLAPKYLETDSCNAYKLIGFNLAIGVVAFILYFYGLPRISTEWFSVLAFIGVISAYIFGWYFLDEGISFYTLIGTMLILFGVYKVHELGYQ